MATYEKELTAENFDDCAQVRLTEGEDTELARLRSARERAEQDYNQADADHIDIAAYRLKAAEEELNTYLRARKAVN